MQVSFSPTQLSDLECIRNVGRQYAHALDRLDADGLRSVYWPDATDQRGAEFTGKGWDYVPLAMESHRRWQPSLHTLLNHLVDLDPGDITARGEIYVIAYLFDTEQPVLHTWFGRYLDRYEKRGDEWRISERVVVHEGSRFDDPLVRMPFPLEQFRQGSFDRPSSGRPIGP
jgi:hypothetical protein